MGLAFDEYYTKLKAFQGRYPIPTPVDIAQSSRHWFFTGKIVIRGSYADCEEHFIILSSNC